MFEILRLIFVLVVICAGSGLALSGVYQFTKEPIRMTMLREQKMPAVKAVFTGPDGKPINQNNPADEMISIPVGEDDRGKPVKLAVFPAKQGGKTVAVAFEASSKGYGGDVGVMVGIDVAKNNLTGISVVSQSETPGLGARIVSDPSFAKSFKGKPLDKKLTKADIDALSGATFSTNAVVAAVNKARKLYAQYKTQMVK